uniref:NACHT domain-containing protein n=1 Tax=Esox lucius TaxID=8010 RepID=A0A6Q2XI75_ESOLU
METFDDFQTDVWMQDRPSSPASEDEDLMPGFDLQSLLEDLNQTLESDSMLTTNVRADEQTKTLMHWRDLDLETLLENVDAPLTPNPKNFDLETIVDNGDDHVKLNDFDLETLLDNVCNNMEFNDRLFELGFEADTQIGEALKLSNPVEPEAKKKICKRRGEIRTDCDRQSKRGKRRAKTKESRVNSCAGSPPIQATMVTSPHPSGLFQVTSSPTSSLQPSITPSLHPTVFHITQLGPAFSLSPTVFSSSGQHTYLLVSSLVPQSHNILPLCPVDSAVAPDSMCSSPPGSRSDCASMSPQVMSPPSASPISPKTDCVADYILQTKAYIKTLYQEIEAGRSLETHYIDVRLVQRQILIGSGKNASKCLEKELVVLGDTERRWSSLSRSQMFQSSAGAKPKQSIVLLGNAGMGKTTLIKKLCLDWSDGFLPQFDFVFLLDGKALTLPHERTYSLQSLLLRLSSSALPTPCARPHAVFSRVLSAPERVLVIFDGFEAVRDLEGLTQCPAVECRGQNYNIRQLFSGLLQRKLLPGCSLLLSARPQGTVSGLLRRADSLLELLGFSPHDIERYFGLYFSGRHSLRTPVPSSTSTRDTVPSSTSTLDTVPSSTSTRDTVPSSTSTIVTVPSSTSTRDTVPSLTSTRDTVPFSTSTRDTVPSSTSTRDTVPSSTSTLDTVPSSTSTRDTVPSSTSTRDTVPSSTSTRDTVPSSTSTRDTVPSSTSTRDTVPSSTSTRDTVPSSTSTRDTVPSSTSTLDTVPSSASTLDTVPSSTSTPATLQAVNTVLDTVMARLHNHSYLMSLCWNPALCHMVCLLLEHWDGSKPLPSTLTGLCHTVLGLMIRHSPKNSPPHTQKELHSPKHTRPQTEPHSPEHTHSQKWSHSPEHTHAQKESHSPEHTPPQNEPHSPEHTHTQKEAHSPEHTHAQKEAHSPEHTHAQKESHSPEQTHTHKEPHSPEHIDTQTYNHSREHTLSQRETQTHTRTDTQTHANTPEEGQKRRLKPTNGHTVTHMRTRSHTQTQTTSAEEKRKEEDERGRHVLSGLNDVAWDGVKGHSSLLNLTRHNPMYVQLQEFGLTTGLLHSYWLRGWQGGDCGSDDSSCDNILSWGSPYLQSFLGGAHLSLSKCVSDRALISQILPQSRGRRRPLGECLDLAQRLAVGLLFRNEEELQDLAVLDSISIDAVVAKRSAVSSHLENLPYGTLSPARLLAAFHCVYEAGEARLARQLVRKLPAVLSLGRVPLCPPDAVVVWNLLEQCRNQRRQFCLDLEDTGLSVSGLRLLTGLNIIHSYRACIADTVAMWEELEKSGEVELLKGTVSKLNINPFRATQVSHVQHLATLVNIHRKRRLPDSQSDSVLEDGIPAVRDLHKLEFELGPVNGPLALPKLLELLPALQSLQHLDLENSKLGDRGSECLAEAVGSLYSLEILNLSQNHIGDQGIGMLAPALCNLTSLNCLSLYSNVISDGGAESLAAVLPQMTSLNDLDVKYNKFTAVGAQSLGSSLRNCPWVKSLGLWNQCIPYGVLERLQEQDPRIQLL